MKKVVWFLCLVVVLVAASFYGVRSCKRLIMRTNAINVVCDVPVDAATAQVITEACKRLFDPLDEAWLFALKKRFPIIARITSAREGDVAQVHISGVTLYARVNEEHVIDDQGNRYAVTGIDPAVLATLPRLRVAPLSDHEIALFKNFVKTLPVFICQRYAVDWQSPYRIYMVSYHDGCTCIVRHDLLPTEELIAFGNQLAFNQTKKTDATIDLRFVDQIVINQRKYIKPG